MFGVQKPGFRSLATVNLLVNMEETQHVIDRTSRVSHLAKQYKLLQFLVFHWLILRRVMSSVQSVIHELRRKVPVELDVQNVLHLKPFVTVLCA